MKLKISIDRGAYSMQRVIKMDEASSVFKDTWDKWLQACELTHVDPAHLPPVFEVSFVPDDFELKKTAESLKVEEDIKRAFEAMFGKPEDDEPPVIL